MLPDKDLIIITDGINIALVSHRLSPVMLFNVLNKLRLNVGLSWNGDGLLHERLIEINFVHLQLQLFGNLKQKRWKSQDGQSSHQIIIKSFVCEHFYDM